MIKMLARMFAMITTYFEAIEKVGKGANHMATWVEESAGAFADEARVQRAAKLKLMNAENQLQIEQSVA